MLIELRLKEEVLKQNGSKYDIVDLTTTYLKSEFVRKIPIDYLVAFAGYVLQHADKPKISKYYGPRRFRLYQERASGIIRFYINFLGAKKSVCNVLLEDLYDISVGYNDDNNLVMYGEQVSIPTETMDDLLKYDQINIISSYFTDELPMYTGMSVDDIIRTVQKSINRDFNKLQAKVVYSNSSELVRIEQ